MIIMYAVGYLVAEFLKVQLCSSSAVSPYLSLIWCHQLLFRT